MFEVPENQSTIFSMRIFVLECPLSYIQSEPGQCIRMDNQRCFTDSVMLLASSLDEDKQLGVMEGKEMGIVWVYHREDGSGKG